MIPLDHRQLYRLPWTLTDNAIAWLEPTAKCNLACEGCYRANVNEHKSLAEVADDLEVFARYRNFDSVSIAGGDPLTHPEVIEIVKMVAARGWKPTINTNGLALTDELLADLKRAGLQGLTFHIDSKQHRPGWKNKTEQQTNDLRLKYAEMVARAGDLICIFNSTVYEDTLDEIPLMVRWAQEHIDIVHGMVFICYREAVRDEFDYYAGGKKVDPTRLVYGVDHKRQRTDINAPEVVERIREADPEFAPSAYLGGTERPDSFKWLLASRLGTKQRIYGHIGPKLMEYSQTRHHARTGRYFAYSDPKMLRRGKAILWAWPIDPALRKPFRRAFFDPRLAFRRVHMQSIVVIQPIDILADGRQNMCDGCPDITVHNGQLVWSCRLEECLNFGQFVRTVPKQPAVQDSATPVLPVEAPPAERPATPISARSRA